jgi:hypothetical protein
VGGRHLLRRGGDLVTAPTKTTCGVEADNLPGACVLDAEHSGRHRDAEGYTWHDRYKHGRPDVYEITWMSGHVERVAAHQVTYPQAGMMLGSAMGLSVEAGAPRVRMHAEVNGEWRLVLAAREDDIRTLRLVTDGEPMPGGEVL